MPSLRPLELACHLPKRGDEPLAIVEDEREGEDWQREAAQESEALKEHLDAEDEQVWCDDRYATIVAIDGAVEDVQKRQEEAEEGSKRDVWAE